jgi:formate dehydrogenase subunit gamma
MTDKGKTMLLRFVPSQRIEHLLLVLSFGMLCLTGLPQTLAHTGFGRALLSLLGGIDTAQTIHHVFAAMLAFEFLYHLGAILYELILVRPRRLSMWPRRHDLREAVQSVAYLAGRRTAPPPADRYDFRQKIEYWALMWGLLVMGATGLILLFPTAVTRFLPGLLVPAARLAHAYEAILAFLAIVTWHFYNAHLAAGIFPLDTSILTGNISAQRMRHEHPLEYERVTGRPDDAL